MPLRNQLNFNTKSPTVKRILKEAAELSQNPTSDYHAEPLEENLFEWHFTLRGPPSPSPYASGFYHGRVILPPTYPLRPPSFRFLTPTGRFEVNREICLSISGHHEETWQPAWGIRTALVAIRAFMDSDAKGQVGGLECNEAARRKMAGESAGWVCGGCGKANEVIMREREEAVAEAAASRGPTTATAAIATSVVVPEELRLAYREDLGKATGTGIAGTSSDAKHSALLQRQQGVPTDSTLPSTQRQSQAHPYMSSSSFTSSSSAHANPSPSVTQSSSTATTITNHVTTNRSPQIPTPTPTPTTSTSTRTTNASTPAWIDRAILCVFIALVFMLLRKVT